MHTYAFLLFTKTELAEELGNELIWCSVPCDFSEDLPSAGEVDLKQVYWHTESQTFVDGLKAFNSLFDQRDVASIREISSVLLDQPSIFKEECIDAIFDLVNVLILKDRDLDVISWDLVQFDLLREIYLVEENDAVAVLRDLKELAILIR